MNTMFLSLSLSGDIGPDYKSSLWGGFISRRECVRMAESSGITAGSGAAGLSSWRNSLSSPVDGLLSLLNDSSAYG